MYKCPVASVLWKQTNILSHVFILVWTNIAERDINVSFENDVWGINVSLCYNRKLDVASRFLF